MNHHLTHWGRVTHICVGKLIIIDSDNGLSPGWHQAIIWTNSGIWSIGPMGTNFSEILIEIHTFSLKKMHLKMSSAKWCLFCLGLNVLTHWDLKKMVADIFCRWHFRMHFVDWKFYILIQILINVFLSVQLTLSHHWFDMKALLFFLILI